MPVGISRKPTFDTVVEHAIYASQYVPILLRINVDLQTTLEDIEDVVDEIADRGGVRDATPGFRIALERIFTAKCRNNDVLTRHWVDLEQQAMALLEERGLRCRAPSLLGVAVPCGAVTDRQWVIDSEGYLYRCQECMGKPDMACGHVSTGLVSGAESQLWSRFDPTKDVVCRDCHVLPLCMGGCIAERIRERQCQARCSKMKYGLEHWLEVAANG